MMRWVVLAGLCLTAGIAATVSAAWVLGVADTLGESLGAGVIGAFAGVAFFVFLGNDHARTQLSRVREGRCPKCNYDLRGELDKGCSECGWGRPE